MARDQIMTNPPLTIPPEVDIDKLLKMKQLEALDAQIAASRESAEKNKRENDKVKLQHEQQLRGRYVQMIGLKAEEEQQKRNRAVCLHVNPKFGGSTVRGQKINEIDHLVCQRCHSRWTQTKAADGQVRLLNQDGTPLDPGLRPDPEYYGHVDTHS